jgi:hypothetical protein
MHLSIFCTFFWYPLYIWLEEIIHWSDELNTIWLIWISDDSLSRFSFFAHCFIAFMLRILSPFEKQWPQDLKTTNEGCVEVVTRYHKHCMNPNWIMYVSMHEELSFWIALTTFSNYNEIWGCYRSKTNSVFVPYKFRFQNLKMRQHTKRPNVVSQ